jgi:ABC-type nitrate/sulfonate/bicarbonate transport system substrate-binding protein
MPRLTDRRAFLRGAAAASALLGMRTAACAAAPDTVTTQLLWIKNVESAGLWIADADGYFRTAGIASNVLAGGPGLASGEAIVAAGRADVGIDMIERIVDAVAAGTDLVVLGAIFQQSPAGLLSLPAHPIRTARDIIGKRIGLQQGARVYIEGILTINHLPHDFEEVVVGFDPQPLVEGACDGYLCFVTNQPLILQAHGVPHVVVSFEQLGLANYGECLYCTRDYLRDHRATLVRYIGALQRGWTENARDPARAAGLAVHTYGAALGLDEKQQIAENSAQIPLTRSAATAEHGLLWIDAKRMAGPIYAGLRATGRTKLPDVDRLIDVSLLRDVAAARRQGG